MNLKYLLEVYDPVDIVNHMQEVYPDESENNLLGYFDVMEQLKETEHIPNDMVIHIVYVDYDFDGGPLDPEDCYHHLHGKKEGSDDTWSLGFHPWGEWLKSEMDVDTAVYDDLDVICHCLWEMTFYGFTNEDVQEELAELDRRVDDIKSGKVEGTRFKSVDEMMDYFKSKIGEEDEEEEA